MGASYFPIGGDSGGSDSPISANPNIVVTLEDTPATFNVIADDVGTNLRVLRLDTHDGQTYQPGVDIPLGSIGTLNVQVSGAAMFTPSLNQNGTCPLIDYEVTNGTDIRLGQIQITVTPVNDGPAVQSPSDVSLTGEMVVFDLLAAFSDPDGDPVTITLINGAAPVPDATITLTNATAVYRFTGKLEVTPDVGFTSGSITGTFRGQDPSGLFADGNFTLQVGVDNRPQFSPIIPFAAGNPEDVSWYRRAPCFFQELWPGIAGFVPAWPNIGPGFGPIGPAYTYDFGRYTPTLDDLREPTLYNRALIAYFYYLRGGPDWAFARQVCLTWITYYFANVVFEADGVTAGFNVEGANQDVKYSYPILAHVYYLLTGSTAFYAKADGLYQNILKYWPKRQPNAPLWTERGQWAAKQACIDKYVRSGGTDATALYNALDYFEGERLIQQDSGVWLHPHSQHEGDSDPTLISSPWMSALSVETSIQLMRLLDPNATYTFWDGTRSGATVIEQIKRSVALAAKWHADRAYVVATLDEPEFANPAPGILGKYLCGYLVGESVITDKGVEDDIGHGLDIRGFMAKGLRCAMDLPGFDTTSMQRVYDDQRQINNTDLEYWSNRTTPQLPGGIVARDNPTRKPAWLEGTTYCPNIRAIFLSNGTPGDVTTAPIAPVVIAAPTLTGSSQQGATLTIHAGTWGGLPTPTLTYQVLRDGVAISGASGPIVDTAIYVSQVADESHQITVQITGTTPAGTATATSNGITIVLAGTPQVTAQPTNQSGLVGDSVTFTATFDATPTASTQAQRSDDHGTSWSNVGAPTTTNTPSYTISSLTGPDNGAEIRFVATNIGGSVATDPAAISIIAAQPAARFAGSTAGGYVVHQFGGAGFTNMMWGGVFLVEDAGGSGNPSTGAIMDMQGVAGRFGEVGFNNTWPVPLISIGDSSALVPFAVSVPVNQYFILVVIWPATRSGTYTATAAWQLLSGDATIHTQTRDTAIEDTIPVTSFAVNGSGSSSHGTGVGQAGALQATYVAVGPAVASVADAIALMRGSDASSFASFSIAQDDGSGGVVMLDKSGNNLPLTLVNATLVASGPTLTTIL